MKLLGLLGVVAFSLACAVVGVRLLRVAARTRQAPELSMGLALVSSGAIGFPLLISSQVIAASSGSSLATHLLSAFGSAFTFLGYIGLIIGTWRIYRPAAQWPRAVLAIGSLVVVGACATVFATRDAAPGGIREIALWTGVAVGVGTFAWSAGESFALYGQMQRRARIGLVEPAVANRVLLWGIGSLAAFAMSAHGLLMRVVLGPVESDGMRLVSSALGMIAAIAIWLAFFPPAAYRRRMARGATA
jgi:hypothetical protein